MGLFIPELHEDLLIVCSTYRVTGFHIIFVEAHATVKTDRVHAKSLIHICHCSGGVAFCQHIEPNISQGSIEAGATAASCLLIAIAESS